MEQPVGEDMPALAIGRQLCFVQRDESVPSTVTRHGFGGAEEVACLRRLDPLFAGNQRDLFLALYRNHPIVNLARQQAQRKADRPA